MKADFNRKAANKKMTAVSDAQLQEIKDHASRLYADASLQYREKFGLPAS